MLGINQEDEGTVDENGTVFLGVLSDEAKPHEMSDEGVDSVLELSYTAVRDPSLGTVVRIKAACWGPLGILPACSLSRDIAINLGVRIIIQYSHNVR